MGLGVAVRVAPRHRNPCYATGVFHLMSVELLKLLILSLNRFIQSQQTKKHLFSTCKFRQRSIRRQ